jgi:hypothetical protein
MNPICLRLQNVIETLISEPAVLKCIVVNDDDDDDDNNNNNNNKYFPSLNKKNTAGNKMSKLFEIM